jgi:hypothetical protein
MVATYVLRFLFGEQAIAGKEGPPAQIEERIVANLLHRYPDFTRSGRLDELLPYNWSRPEATAIKAA